MSTIELELYDLLKLKIGERETKAFFTLIENKIEAKKDELASKYDVEKVRADLKLEIEKVNSQLLVIKWMLGVVLAGIISIMLKTYFV